MIDLVQKICRTYARPTNHPGGALSYLFILFFLPICRPAEASNQELFAIKKCRFAAALKLFCKEKKLLSYHQPETITMYVHNFQRRIFF